MNTKSIRFRLTILYASVLCVVIAVLFASFYWVTQRELYRHTDILLRSHATTVLELLRQQDMGSAQVSSLVLYKEARQIPGMIILVVNHNGEPLYVSPNLSEPDRLLKILVATSKSQTEYFVNAPAGSQTMRFVLSPIQSDGGKTGMVIVGHPIDIIQDALTSLYGILIVISVLFVVPGIFIGFMLVGRTLRPVRILARQIEAINDNNLSGRVLSPQTHDELEELTHSFNDLLGRLDKTFRRERQFIADVAHELKTPIATLKTSIEIASHKKRSIQEYQKILQSASRDTDRISQTLTNILDIAWSQTDMSQQKLSTVKLSTMFDELSEIAETLALVKHIHIQTQTEAGITVVGKKDALFRAILNVIENAVKYTSSEGSVSMTLEKRNSGAYMTVKDTGIGIAKDDIPHIFDRFYRGSKTDETIGSGLGLSITKAIIVAHGGDISVSSRQNHGTTFYLYIPQGSGATRLFTKSS